MDGLRTCVVAIGYGVWCVTHKERYGGRVKKCFSEPQQAVTIPDVTYACWALGQAAVTALSPRACSGSLPSRVSLHVFALLSEYCTTYDREKQ